MLDIENIIQIVVVLVIIAAVYLMLIRPQLKRPTLHQELLSSLKIGDQIVTYGGLIGEIVQIENENVFEVEFSKSHRIKVLRDSVERKFIS